MVKRMLLSTGHVARFHIITFYLKSCFGQETAKEPFGLQVKLPSPPVYHWRLHNHTAPYNQHCGTVTAIVLVIDGQVNATR